MEIKLTFVGDVLMDGDMVKYLDHYRSSTGKLDFQPTFSPMSRMFHDSDFVLANLETPISDNEEDYTCKRWEFCTAYEFADALHNVGVNYVSTANNHCLDRGIPGLIKTVQCLNKIGLFHSGIDCPGEEKKRLIVNIGGVKIGLLSYTYGTNAVSNGNYLGFKKNRKLVNLIQEQEGALDRFDPVLRYARRHPGGYVAHIHNALLRTFCPENVGKEWFEKTTLGVYRRDLLSKELRELRRLGVDLTVMYLHVGGQYNENPNYLTKKTIRWLQKKNCNIIIGNHEHVVHGSIHDLQKNQFATYAIGNFLGSAGTLHAPFDRYAEYSIAVHVFINKKEKRLSKITFSVLVAKHYDDGTYKVWPVADLIACSSDEIAEKLTADCLTVAKLFSGQNYEIVQNEFTLCEA